MHEQLVDTVVEKIMARNARLESAVKADMLDNIKRRSPAAKEYVDEFVQQEMLNQAWAQRTALIIHHFSDVIEAVLKELETRLTTAAA